MDFLHRPLDIGPNDIVRVSLNKSANVMLLSEVNFQRYRAGRQFEYYGRRTKVSPVDLCIPRKGRWHLVIDGASGMFRYSVQVIRG